MATIRKRGPYQYQAIVRRLEVKKSKTLRVCLSLPAVIRHCV